MPGNIVFAQDIGVAVMSSLSMHRAYLLNERSRLFLIGRLEITVDYGLYGRLPQVFAELDARVESEEFSDSVKITLSIREVLDCLFARKHNLTPFLQCWQNGR